MSGSPRYWVGVVSREHVLRGVEVGFAMLNHGKEAPLRRLSGGDGFVYYSPRTSYPHGEPLKAFTALGVVGEEEPFVAEMGPVLTGWRREVSWDRDARHVPIAAIQGELDFAREAWGMKARLGLFEITGGDFATIKAAMMRDR